MDEKSGVAIINDLRKKWMAFSIALFLLISLMLSYILASFLHKFFTTSLLWSIPSCIVVFVSLLFLDRSWKIQSLDIARFLNAKYPALEESTELLLQPVATLPFLQQLQAKKTEEALLNIPVDAKLYGKRKRFVLAFGSVLLIGIAFTFIPYNPSTNKKAAQVYPTVKPVVAEKLLTSISAVNVTIFPPGYTGKPARSQQQMNLLGEEGATIKWQISTRAAVKRISFIFNDSKVVELAPVNKEHTKWATTRKLNLPGFYQVKMDTIVSELYKMEMLKDQPPIINVRTPKPTTVIDFGEPEKTSLNVTVSDDYGIVNATVLATISSGSGEGVKFAQQKINFDASFAARLPKYELKKSIDLKAVGMHPGDELYFYISAIDSKLQEKRSDIYIVSITDTTQLMSMDGLLNGVSIKPEYFRSQRQIIIETEQLIKDKKTMGEEAFRNHSNNLGLDQKLLRLRYGKFLGEEGESNQEEQPEAVSDVKDFGNAEKILDAYTDKHDDAETADFFEIATKNQLKATLTEMWNAESKLRIFNAEQALPFEYKALRLLKDLQQKSRAYVAKTSIATTPLKPEKRLSGELDKIVEPARQINIQNQDSKVDAISTALSVLEQLKQGTGMFLNPTVLQSASIQLANKAIVSPSEYLPALQALRRILSASPSMPFRNMNDISLVQKALQKMIEAPVTLPSMNKKTANGNLSGEYFKNLNRTAH